MTNTLEPGAREHYLSRLDAGEILAHSREWYEADGSVELSEEDNNRLASRLEQKAVPALGYWLDWSGARPNLTVAKQTGARGVSRYIAPDIASTAWKRLGTAERDQILKVLGDLELNWEWYAGRCLEGAVAGHADGKMILKAAQALSYPHGRVIPVSHDIGTNNDVAVIAYFKAVKAEQNGIYGITPYGSFHTATVITPAAGLINVPWQTAAWSSRQKATNAAKYQNTNQWFNGTVDENEIWKMPFGSWNHPLIVPKPPAPPSSGPIDFAKVVALYKTQAEFEAAVESQVLNVISSALWGDPRGLTPAQMWTLTHGRPSLGVYDGMSTFSRGRYVRFPKDLKSPTAIYEKVGDKLLWLSATDWKELNTPFALLPVVDHSITGNVYKLSVADGTTDPRQAVVGVELLNYDEVNEDEAPTT